MIILLPLKKIIMKIQVVFCLICSYHMFKHMERKHFQFGVECAVQDKPGLYVG